MPQSWSQRKISKNGKKKERGDCFIQSMINIVILFGNIGICVNSSNAVISCSYESLNICKHADKIIITMIKDIMIKTVMLGWTDFNTLLFIAGITQPRRTSPRRKKKDRKPSREANLSAGEEEGEGKRKNKTLAKNNCLSFKSCWSTFANFKFNIFWLVC